MGKKLNEEPWVPRHIREEREEKERAVKEAERVAAIYALGTKVGKCWYCEREVYHILQHLPLRATMDHKVPSSRGGRWLNHNTVLACQECNYEKLTKTTQELLVQYTLNYCSSRTPVKFPWRDE